MARISFDTSRPCDYQKFLAVRRLPIYRFVGRDVDVPDEYAAELLGTSLSLPTPIDLDPHPLAFDYQRDIAALAIRKRKFSAFIECGLGKTLLMLMFARHAKRAIGPERCVLIVSPLMVIPQTLAEAWRFYPGMEIRQVKGFALPIFLKEETGIGITNFESLTKLPDPGRIGALIVDESSMLKSHYGKWGANIIQLGRGLDWKLALTGTPAPNDRIEYANHAVLMDACRTANEFLARYFVNRGQTQNRWEMKPHALGSFYRDLSHWCIFLNNPATYGWQDNTSAVPPINIHVHHVEMADEQKRLVQQETGELFSSGEGGIGQRSRLAQIAKGFYRGERIATRKPQFIRQLVDSWPEESTIVWCEYNDEQAQLAAQFPEAANISGETPDERRIELIDEFKRGARRVIISKSKILGFGLNLQRATRQVFSALQDSYEKYWQNIKRSNRIGSTLPLNVHIPITEIEEPMVQNVLRKAERVQQDTEEQEREFRKRAWISF